MRRTKEEATKTRKDLLNAALQVFSRQGYQAARLQDIAKAAGINPRAIYHHIGSKAGLYNTMMDEVSAQESGAVEAAIAEYESLIEIMARIMSYSLALLETDRRLRRVFELSLFKAQTDPELEEVLIKRVEGADLQINNTAGIIAQSVSNGELRADLDSATLARAFIVYLNGEATLWLTNHQAFSLKDKAADFADILMRGLLTG
jgi:AcrR family transcriptional regulator